MAEQWKDVKGYEGLYQVSDQGRVKSLGQRVAYKSRWGTIAYRDYPAKIMHPTDNGCGYMAVILSKDKKIKRHFVHRLVAEAFIGEIGSLEINHKDYNPRNNAVSNLEIVTHQENVNHSLDNMRKPKTRHKKSRTGEKYICEYRKSPQSKLKYRVTIYQFGIQKVFSTLESAINFRDQVIKNEQEYFTR